jgi:hypothetical protein
VKVALFERVAASAAIEKPANLVLRLRDIVWMRDVGDRARAHFLGRVAEHRAEFLVGFLEVPVDVRDADAENGLREDRAKTLFACAKRPFGPVAGSSQRVIAAG